MYGEDGHKHQYEQDNNDNAIGEPEFLLVDGQRLRGIQEKTCYDDTSDSAERLEQAHHP